MQQINQFVIFEFGSNVRALLMMPENATLVQFSAPLFALQTTLRKLIAGDPVQLHYSMGNIKEALNALDTVDQIEFRDKDGNFDFSKDWSKPVTPWFLGTMRDCLVKLEHTLSAEFEKTATYLVAKTTSFDTETLIERATETFTEEVRSELSEMAVFDFTEAGKCLGFGLHTAAGFHLARATEAVMTDYCAVFGVTVTNKDTWGVLLNSLSGCKGSQTPDKSTLSILEQIKNVDRNDLMHPRKTLGLTEATRLFHLATGAIIAMAMEIKTKSGKAAQGNLQLEAPADVITLPVADKVEAAE